MSISAISSPPSTSSTTATLGADSSTEDTGFLAVFTAESSRSNSHGAPHVHSKFAKNPFTTNKSDIDTTASLATNEELAEILELIDAETDASLSLLNADPIEPNNTSVEQLPITPFDFLAWTENARMQGAAQDMVSSSMPEAVVSEEDPAQIATEALPSTNNVISANPQIDKEQAPTATMQSTQASVQNTFSLPTTNPSAPTNAQSQSQVKMEDMLNQRKNVTRQDSAQVNGNGSDKISQSPLVLLKNAQWMVHTDATNFEKSNPLELTTISQNLDNLTHSAAFTKGNATESKISVPIAPASPTIESIQGKTQEALKWMINQRVQSAEIRLNPEELGPISVRLRLEGSETIVAFYAHHEPTRQLLEQSVHLLKEQLQNSGMSVADSFIGENTDQSSFDSFHRKGNYQAEDDGITDSAELDGELMEESITQQSGTSTNGRVDIFA